jgi:hypothetical protein
MLKPLLLILIGILMPLDVTFGQAEQNRDERIKSDVTDENSTKTVSPLRKLIDESLTWDELFSSDQSTVPMTARLAMRWANNTRGSESGVTILYIADGRPEVVCSIYPWEKSLIHEFDSLSRNKPIAKRGGKVVWTPETPGLQFQVIRDAETPAETPSARLRQMKSLSRRFTSTMLGWRSDKSDREELRLLPQPLFRYDSKRKDLLDGAVFAFTQGTDPESLLLIEAIPGQERSEWQFAFVRNTSGELEGRDSNKVVWHADRYPDSNNLRSTHFSISKPIDASILADFK